tara:strand:+ start:44 stop:1033 length:990 start_codon:yes stop_codon:yes gene_type:complete
MTKNFKALTTIENDNGTYKNIIKEKSIEELPHGDILIKVEFSSLNYKDALSASGNKGITKKYPHTPGIDATGIVEVSNNSEFTEGTAVIVNGYDLGMNTSGGFGEYIRVPSSWAVPVPSGFSKEQTMGLGCAGLTAGLLIKALQENSIINQKSVLVSGATGGVGCIAVKLLAHLGANVTAVTGKSKKSKFLKNIGAKNILVRDEFIDSTRLPMSKGIYDFAIDVAGGKTLSAILASMKYNGVVACCGNVSDANFETSVFPFILRGNRLIGIDSASKPINEKAQIWNLFSKEWSLPNLKELYRVVSLKDMPFEIKKILKGKQTGRVVLKH